jgi:hypothetical protein
MSIPQNFPMCRLPQWGLLVALVLPVAICPVGCSRVDNNGKTADAQSGAPGRPALMGDSHFGFSVVYGDVIDSEWNAATILGVNSQLDASREVAISDLPLALMFQVHVTRTTCNSDITVSILGEGIFAPVDTLKVIPLSENLTLAPVRIETQNSSVGRSHELTFIGRCNGYETVRVLRVSVRPE